MFQLQQINISSDKAFNTLLPIYNSRYGQLVNARELHFALGIKKKFSDWIKNYLKHYNGYHCESDIINIDYLEDYDYFSYDVKATQGRGKSKEYFLSLDVAKEIAMLTRNILGKEVRKYFIRAEKMLRQTTSMNMPVVDNTQEKIAEALLISQNIIKEKDKLLKNALKSKEYNKRINAELRKEIKQLKSNQLSINEKRIQLCDYNSLKEKEQEIEYLENSIERLEDQNAQLKARISHLINVKINGKEILNALAQVDIARRQKFVIGTKAKEDARKKAYILRKQAILNAGIILNDSTGKCIDRINIIDMPKAISAYVESLKKTINDVELFEELFSNQLKLVDSYMRNISIEEEAENTQH